MKFICDFIFRKNAFEKAIEESIVNEELIKKILLKATKAPNSFQNSDEKTRGAMFLASAAVGLLKLGFSKEEALTLLESLFIIEISEGGLSPGNDLIH